MSYIKKICLLKECKKGFSTTGNTLQGMIKCEQNANRVNIELSLTNLAPLKNDKYILFIGNSSKNIVYELSTGFCNFYSSVELLDISYPFAVIILLENSCEVVMFGKTLDYPSSLKDFLQIYKDKRLDLYLEDEQIEKEIEKEFLYSDDVVATENYYENKDVDLKNLTLKAEENENPKNENSYPCDTAETKSKKETDSFAKDEQPNCNCQEEIDSCNDTDCPSLTDFASIVNEQEENCFCINEDVENLLNTYPRFTELENAIYGSKWVTISLEGCEYYFGRTIIEKDSYLCYAVKGEQNCCPTELKDLATFIPSPYSKNKGYYVMFQKEN